MPLKRTPLDLASLPATLQKPLSPQAPVALRMMAARARLPLPPPGLVTLLYQLTFDAESEVSEAARASFAELAEHVCQAVVSDDTLDPRVLDILALEGPLNVPQLGRLVLNPQVDDATVAAIAGRAEEGVTEIIAGIHVRLLRAPEIIMALYENPGTRQSTLDKIIDLAKREGIEVPGLELVMEADDLEDDAPGLDEQTFTELLKASHARADEEKAREQAEGPTYIRRPEDAEDEEPKEEEKRLGRWALIQRMKASQKIRLASLGSREDRAILIRERKRVVFMAVIRSPRVSASEVQKYAHNRTLPDEVIAFIAQKRDWVSKYPIVLALVKNPKCPLADSLRFLTQLRATDLQKLQRDRNISSVLARQATALYRQKTTGRRGS